MGDINHDSQITYAGIEAPLISVRLVWRRTLTAARTQRKIAQSKSENALAVVELSPPPVRIILRRSVGDLYSLCSTYSSHST